MQISDLVLRAEAISKKYAELYQIKRTQEWFVLKVQEEIGELTQAFLAYTGQARKDGSKEEIESELADVLCQLILMGHHLEIDIEKAVRKKWLKWEKVYEA